MNRDNYLARAAKAEDVGRIAAAAHAIAAEIPQAIIGRQIVAERALYAAVRSLWACAERVVELSREAAVDLRIEADECSPREVRSSNDEDHALIAAQFTREESF